MKSFETIKLFMKLGLLPLAEEKHGHPKINLWNKMFILINLFWILPLLIFIYFTVSDFLGEELNLSNVISLSFRLVASSSGALYPVMLAFTSQRLGINSFLRDEQLLGLKKLDSDIVNSHSLSCWNGYNRDTNLSEAFRVGGKIYIHCGHLIHHLKNLKKF